MTTPSARVLAGRRLLVVLAHPDDESLACGGTIARCVDEGAAVRLICATRGAAGAVNPDLDIPRDALPAVRAAELDAAAAVLGLEDVELLDFRDGMLPWLDAGAFRDRLAEAIAAWRADAVITFGRDGLYWHPDHIAICERTRDAVTTLPAHLAPTLYCVTLPPDAMTRVASAPGVMGEPRRPWGVAPEIFGRGAPEPTHVVDVRAVIRRKVDALRCHRSQLASDNPLAHLTYEIAAAALGVEHFHVADCSPRRDGLLDPLNSAGEIVIT